MKDKVVIITGATGQLGRTVTRAFLEAGANAVALYTRESALSELRSQLPTKENRLMPVRTNVLNEPEIQSMVDAVTEKFGRIDALLNLVGGFLGGVSLPDTTEAQWDKMMSLNLKSAFLCSKHVFPAMQRQKYGRIVNVAAKGGIEGTAGMAAYSAAKAGIINLTQALSDEGREYNITANVIAPSIIDTPENRKAMPKANFDDWVTPDSIARTLLFLTSNDAADISGATIPIFGKA